MRDNKRNGNVEVLRCLLMFLIVFHHVGFHGYFARPTDWWSLLIWGFVMWHVDGFVAISGWFGIRLNLRKIASLYGVMLFYTAIGCVLWRVFDPSTFGLRSFLVHGGWFGGGYLMLMLMSPMVNASLEHLGQDRRALFCAWLLFAVGMILTWIPGHLNTAVSSGAGAWSLLCLLFVYVSARVARRLFERPVPLKYLMYGLCVLPAGICLCGGSRIVIRLAKGKDVAWSMLNYLSAYDAPHIWLFALLIVMLFAWHVKLPEKVKQACSFMGPSMFGVYMMHEVMHNGRLIYRIPQEWLHSHGVSPFACVFLTAVSTFLICLAVDLCRRVLLAPVKGRMMALLDSLESNLRLRVCGLFG